MGIYKGKDEKIQEHSSKITVKSKPEEDKDNKDDKENKDDKDNKENKDNKDDKDNKNKNKR